MTSTIDHPTQQDAADHYAGPFCTCGDYSCPAMNDDTARCVNTDRDDVDTEFHCCPCREQDCAARVDPTAECDYSDSPDGIPVRRTSRPH